MGGARFFKGGFHNPAGFMQNAPVATSIKKPGDASSGPKSHDFMLDPLPVPEAIESNGDTAWGLWEDTLEEQKGGKPGGDAHPDFEDTVAIDPDDPDLKP